MANIAAYGKDLTTGQYRLIDPADTATDDQGNPLGGGAGADGIDEFILLYGGDLDNGINFFLVANGRHSALDVDSTLEEGPDVRLVSPVAGTITKAVANTRTGSSSGDVEMSVLINDSAQGTFVILDDIVSYSGLNISVAQGDHISVERTSAGTNPQNTTLQLYIEPTTPSESGVLLPYGADQTTASPNYLHPCGEHTQGGSGSIQSFNRLTIPISGTITRCAWYKESSGTTTWEYVINGVAGSTFSSASTGNTGVITGLSQSITAGDDLAFNLNSGTTPNKTNLNFIFQPSDGSKGIFYILGADTTSSQLFHQPHARGDEPGVGGTDGDLDEQSCYVLPYASATVKAIGVYKGTTGNGDVDFTVFAQDPVTGQKTQSVPLTIPSASASTLFSDVDFQLPPGARFSIKFPSTAGDTGDTNFVVYIV